MLQTGSCPEELPVWQRGERGSYKPYPLSTQRPLESKGQYKWNDLDISPREVPHQGDSTSGDSTSLPSLPLVILIEDTPSSAEGLPVELWTLDPYHTSSL